jgi:endoglucanase
MKPAKLLAITGCAIVLLLSIGGCGAPAPTATPSATTKSTATKTATPTITNTPTVGPGGFPRKFHVEGNAFVDQFGQKMIFRGMNMMSSDTFFFHQTEQVIWNEHYFEVMASWGTKIVRVPIFPGDITYNGWSAIFKALDQTITWAGENKMYVDIDFHSVGWIPDNWFLPNNYHETTNKQDFLDFWNYMSNRYADNDIVAFYELFNEPIREGSAGSGSAADWQVWKELAEQAIAVIRANDPDKIILVGGLQAAYKLSYVAANPVEGKNIGYATHPYPWNTESGRSLDVAFGNLSKNYPVFATEVGCGDSTFLSSTIDYLEEHQIGWMAWYFGSLYDCNLLDKKFYPDLVPSYQGGWFRSRLLYELEGSPKPRPSNFTKVNPKDGLDDSVTNPTLRWWDSIHADSYEYCIDASNNNACDASWVSVGEQIYTFLKGLTVGKTYYWQVRAINKDGLTYADGGGWGSFTVANITNLSLFRPVTASSTENSTSMPENAVDGDYFTRWASKFYDPQWIQVDLGAVFDIRRIVLYWGAAFATSYEIQVSMNGTSWTTIYSTTSGNGETDELNVSGSGRYVRIYGKVRNIFPNGQSYGYILYEFEVYGG